MMNTCEERFEIWADTKGFDLLKIEGKYDDPATSNAWECWKTAWTESEIGGCKAYHLVSKSAYNSHVSQ